MKHELTDDFNVHSALSALLHPLSLSSRLNIFLPNPSARLLAACPEPIQQSRTNGRSFIHLVFDARAGCTQPRSAKSSSQTLEREWTSSSLSVSLSHTNAPRRGVQLSAALSKCRWARRRACFTENPPSVARLTRQASSKDTLSWYRACRRLLHPQPAAGSRVMERG